MAEVILKNLKKVYPNAESKKAKKGEPQKKGNLQITDEGVVAVQDFNLHIADPRTGTSPWCSRAMPCIPT